MPNDPELKRTETIATRFTPVECDQIHDLACSLNVTLSDFSRLALRVFAANVATLAHEIHSYLGRFRFRECQAEIETKLGIIIVQALGNGGEELAVKARNEYTLQGHYWLWAISEGCMVRFGVTKASSPDEPLKESLGCKPTIGSLEFAEWLGEQEIGREFWFGGAP